MPQVLLVVAILFLAFAAPVKVTVLTLFALIVVTCIVQVTANRIVRASFTLTESFKAIVLSLFFSAIWTFTLFSFSKGADPRYIDAASSLVGTVGRYVAFILGFRFGLGIAFPYAAIVAVVSSLASLVFLVALGKLL